MDNKKVLFVSQEITPYLPETELSQISRNLPQAIQETGKEIRRFEGHEGPVFAVAFSPDGETLASGSIQEIRLWDLGTGETKGMLTGHTDHFHAVTFSPEGSTLASASWDGTVRLWRAP